MDKNNELVAVIEQQGLQPSKVDSLMSSFAGYFTEAKKIAGESKDIVVSNEAQIEDMARAREYRLKLKEIRVNADKTREELKSQSLREGNAIQGVFNIIKALIVPVEEYLEKQEKFAEFKEMERKASLYGERVEKLSKYVTDVTLYNIKDMADEVFANLLAGCQASWEKAREDEANAEKDRLAKIESDKIEQEKIRIENQKLKEEADKREAEIAKERAKQADALKKLNDEKEKVEAKLRAEKEAQVQKDADDRAKIEADNKAKEEIERQKLLAPDKEKLLEFAVKLSLVTAPAVKSKDADTILGKAMSKVLEAVAILQEESKKL